MQDNKKAANIQATADRKTGLGLSYNSLSNHEQIMLHYLFFHFVIRQKSLINFLEVSSSHLGHGYALSQEILTGKKRKHKHHRSRNYLKGIEGLIEKGIIERTNSYLNHPYDSTKNKCKEIRFTQEFIQSKGTLDLLKTLVKHQKVRTNNKIRRNANSKVSRLSLEKGVHIHSTIEQLVTPEFIQGRFVRYSDTYDSFKSGVYNVMLRGKKLEQPLTLERALEIAAEENLDVFYRVREKIIIIDRHDFLNTKLFEIRLVYSIILENIAIGNHFPATISDTNKRLTTPFTVIPNSLLKLGIILFNKKPLLTFDIANSQFTILANIIKSYRNFVMSGGAIEDPLYKLIEQEQDYIKTLDQSFTHLLDYEGNFKQDVSRFINAACSGKLYEHIVINHNTKNSHSINRGYAKVGMFIVAFAKPNYNPALKTVVKNVYPNVIKFIDTFKRLQPKKDKQNFAVFLQRIEAAICVDNVLLSLQSKYPILTRHDSFTTMLLDDDTNEQFRKDIGAILDKFLTGYVLKRENYHS